MIFDIEQVHINTDARQKVLRNDHLNYNKSSDGGRLYHSVIWISSFYNYTYV